MFIKIINLKKRTDRKDKCIKDLSEIGIDNYEFIEAVDGSELKPTKELKKLFENNDFNNRKSFIGCALSHYNLWKKLLEDNDNDFYLILEDDFQLVNNFKEKLELLNSEFINKDLLFLGYSMFDKNRNQDTYNQVEEIKVEKLNKNLYIGGTFSYSINKTGASKMIDYINLNGIKHGIDYVIKIADNLDKYEVQPELSYSEWNENNKVIDSDIQFNYDIMDFESFEDDDPFIFLKELDQNGNDIYYSDDKTISFLKNLCLKHDNYIGFNTLGFIKNNLDNLSPSIYFKDTDGIYIKKSVYEEYNRKIRVKMLCNWCSSYQLCTEFGIMGKEQNIWNNIEITWEDNNIDYYVIINKPLNESEFYIPQKTIVFQMDPWVYDINKNWGIKTWGKWANPENFLKVIGRNTDDYNNIVWQLEKTYTELSNLKYEPKLNKISSICTSKYFDEGHVDRINFLKFLDEKNDIELDIFNRDNLNKFKNYKGPLEPYKDKSKGYIPYKYYFMVESNYEKNFITEKLWEPILCECLCFYYGCPNVLNYVNKDAFVLLDMNDFEKSYQIIKRSITIDLWSKRIEIIRREKNKFLNEMQFFPRIKKILKECVF